MKIKTIDSIQLHRGGSTAQVVIHDQDLDGKNTTKTLHLVARDGTWHDAHGGHYNLIDNEFFKS